MIRTCILAGVTLLALGACNGSSGTAGGTPIPKSDADKQKLASSIATMVTDPKMYDSMFDTMRTSMMPMFDRMCDSVPASQQAGCPERMAKIRPVIEESMKESMDKVKGIMPEMMQDMGAVMARVYTSEELAAMNDFYSSPEGKSIMKKQPQVMAEYMPKAMMRMQQMQGEMVQKMQKRLMDAMKDAGMPPPSAPPI